MKRIAWNVRVCRNYCVLWITGKWRIQLGLALLGYNHQGTWLECRRWEHLLVNTSYPRATWRGRSGACTCLVWRGRRSSSSSHSRKRWIRKTKSLYKGTEWVRSLTGYRKGKLKSSDFTLRKSSSWSWGSNESRIAKFCHHWLKANSRFTYSISRFSMPSSMPTYVKFSLIMGSDR